VIDEAPGAACCQQTGASQIVEVMRQRGARHFEAAFDLIYALSLWTGANEQPENCESIFLPQSCKLFDPSVHPDISSSIELNGEARASVKRTTPRRQRTRLQ
jgi:hypothetical protein